MVDSKHRTFSIARCHLGSICSFALASLISLALPTPLHAADHALKVTDAGEGMARVVTVESPGQFRLGFELATNAGLSQWYDLVNDPQAKTCLTATPTNGRPQADQGALFNQVINPDDLIGHARIAGDFHKDVPRSLDVIEKGPARAVVVCKYHPMFSHVNMALQFTTTYTIYPTCRIGIRNELAASAVQELTEWRNCTITLGDPTYQENLDSGHGELSVDGKQFHVEGRHWKPDQWAGYQIEQDPYISYQIDNNTADTLNIVKKINGAKDLVTGPFTLSSIRTQFGWLRKDSRIRWDDPAQFFYEYWDSTTPDPFKNWSRASVLLVPAPGNPHQGGGPNTHEWPGTKRFYLVEGKFTLAKGDSVVQHYEMQLGAQNSTLLPTIDSLETAASVARDYRQPLKSKGFYFDTDQACYVADASLAEQVFTVPLKSNLIKPAFRLPAAGDTIQVSLNGKPITVGQEYLSQKTTDSYVILFLKDLPSDAIVSFRQKP